MPIADRLRDALRPGVPSRTDLLALIRLVDLAWADDRELVERIVARMTVLAAPLRLQRVDSADVRRRVSATADAAAAWLDDPTDANHRAYFAAATTSYPFGPGDGCLAVSELGDHGTPGAGCRSGAGFLACLFPVDDDLRDRVEVMRHRLEADELAEAEMYEAVELSPWLGVHGEVVYDEEGRPRLETSPRPEVPVPDLQSLFTVFRDHEEQLMCETPPIPK